MRKDRNSEGASFCEDSVKKPFDCALLAKDWTMTVPVTSHVLRVRNKPRQQNERLLTQENHKGT